MSHSPKFSAARNEVSRLRALMCAAEGVPTNSKFVEFNASNPFRAEYNKVMKVYLRLRRAQQARAARREAIASLGMKEVRGALGGRYIE